MTARHRKEILETLYQDFKDYNLPADITFAGYLQITGKGPMRRAIKKNYNTWPRVMKGLLMAYPDLFEDTPEVVEVKEPTPAPEVDPLAALGKASTSVEGPETTDG